MLSLHSVEAQICIAHAESKGCFTSLDPCSIPTYVSFESLLQIFFFSIPLSSKKKKKVSILPIFLPPSSQCASMPKMNHCIIIFLLLVSFRWLSLSACFVLACRSSLTCGAGSLLGFRSARESLFSWGHPRASSPCYDPRSGLRRREGVADFGGNGGC